MRFHTTNFLLEGMTKRYTAGDLIQGFNTNLN